MIQTKLRVWLRLKYQPELSFRPRVWVELDAARHERIGIPEKAGACSGFPLRGGPLAKPFFSDYWGGAIIAVADVVGMEVLSATLLSEAGCFPLSFWAGELSITPTCNEKNHKRQREGHPQPKLQFTVTTSTKRQTLKSAESQHVKQNKPSTCQLFFNSKHSLSKNKQLCTNSRQMMAGVSTLHTV